MQAVRFADTECADFVIIVMSEGEVYVLEQQKDVYQIPGTSERTKKSMVNG